MLGAVPGLAGLFVAAVYGAALSSISGAMNSLAAISITDFIKPLYFKIHHEELKESIAGPLTKLLGKSRLKHTQFDNQMNNSFIIK